METLNLGKSEEEPKEKLLKSALSRLKAFFSNKISEVCETEVYTLSEFEFNLLEEYLSIYLDLKMNQVIFGNQKVRMSLLKNLEDIRRSGVSRVFKRLNVKFDHAKYPSPEDVRNLLKKSKVL